MELNTNIVIEFNGRIEEYTLAELKEEFPGIVTSDIDNLVEDIFEQVEGSEGVEINGFIYSK